ncbi:MAG: SpoIIE family protein phosphatase [Nocardioidaceae bacterium]
MDHLNGLDEAALATDAAGQIIFANTTARRLYRFLGEDVSRVSLVEALFPEEERGAFGEVARQALGGLHWNGRLGVLRVDGSVHPADVGCSPLRRGGAVVGLVCVIDDAVTQRGHGREVRRLGDRLTRLARVAAELGTAEDVETVTKVVTSQAADAVGATVASLSLVVDEDTIALVGLRGGQEGAAERWATYSVHDLTPSGDALRSGEPLVLIGREAIAARYPDLETAAPGQRSMVALPLRVVGRSVGVITLSFPGHRELDAAELEFFGILADSCAQALERIRAEKDADEQAARVRFLADATTELSKSLDYEVTLANVARLAVPRFADWCAIDVLEDNQLHRLAVEHVDPAKVRFALELEQRYPSDPEAPGGPWDVIRSRQPLLVPEVTDEMLVAAARDEEHLRLARELQLRSAVTVPLLARERAFGVMTWVSAESGLRYTEADVAFAEDLAKRAAIAIDNAQLYSQTKEAAVRLQQAVLPDLSASIPGWEVASVYDPAGRTDVGGDFYDAFALPDGRLALFVGDVMGRGVAAAAAMAQMRSAIRAHIAVDANPEVVLSKLDLLFATYPMSQLVTLVYAVLDPTHENLQLINAGHPAAVLLRADGSLEQLPDASGAPLGLPTGPRRHLTYPFRAGDALLTFTDGLIERRHEDIDQGQSRLLAAARDLVQAPLHQGLSRLVEEVRDPTRDDDVAALVVKRVS